MKHVMLNPVDHWALSRAEVQVSVHFLTVWILYRRDTKAACFAKVELTMPAI